MTKKWQKLRGKIYDQQQDVTLFDEAIKCLEAKAFRMAYIATWICIAESLKNKFKIMAQKDTVADKIVQEIEKLEQEHRPPDRFILDKARELGIIDEIVYKQVENIFKMRNLFAHPYHIAPTKEEVTSAIIIAVDKILATQPLLRKPYIDNLLDNLQSNRHFIDDLERKVIEFAQDTVARVSPNLYCYLVKELFYRLNTVVSDPDKEIFANRLIWFARACIKQINPDFSKPEWRLIDKFNDFSKAVSLVCATPELWPLIPENIQDSIISYLLYPEESGAVVTPEERAVILVYELAKHGKLSKRQKEKLNDVLRKFNPDTLVSIGLPIEVCIDGIKERFKSYNYYIQNPAAEAIKLAGPKGIKNLAPDNLEYIGRNVLQSAEGGARSSIFLIFDILKTKWKWPEPFVKGLLFECLVNEKEEFRCKNTYLKEVILITIRNNQGDPLTIIDLLIQTIKKSKPKDEGVYLKIDESIKALEKTLNELQEEEKNKYEIVLNSLIDALTEIKNARKNERGI